MITIKDKYGNIKVQVDDTTPINVNVVSGGSTNYYTTLIDAVSSTISYIGKANPGAATSTPSWQIQKIDTSSGLVLEFASGNSTFDKIWDDRLTYTYS